MLPEPAGAVALVFGKAVIDVRVIDPDPGQDVGRVGDVLLVTGAVGLEVLGAHVGPAASRPSAATKLAMYLPAPSGSQASVALIEPSVMSPRSRSGPGRRPDSPQPQKTRYSLGVDLHVAAPVGHVAHVGQRGGRRLRQAAVGERRRQLAALRAGRRRGVQRGRVGFCWIESPPPAACLAIVGKKIGLAEAAPRRRGPRQPPATRQATTHEYVPRLNLPVSGRPSLDNGPALSRPSSIPARPRSQSGFPGVRGGACATPRRGACAGRPPAHAPVA